MSAYDFDKAKQVFYGYVPIKEVKLGTQHVWPPQLQEITLQLPDNPFDTRWRQQTIPVLNGQTVILKFPKNPLPAMNTGWRHMVWVGWDASVNEATDVVATNAVTTNAPPGSTNPYHYVNHGVGSVNRLTARGFDMYTPLDITIHVTDKINPGFWIVPVSGNYKTDDYDLQSDALFYLKLVDTVQPIPPPQVLP